MPVCKDCKAHVSLSAKFCGACGAAMSNSIAPALKSSASAEKPKTDDNNTNANANAKPRGNVVKTSPTAKTETQFCKKCGDILNNDKCRACDGVSAASTPRSPATKSSTLTANSSVKTCECRLDFIFIGGTFQMFQIAVRLTENTIFELLLFYLYANITVKMLRILSYRHLDNRLIICTDSLTHFTIVNKYFVARN